MQSPASKTAGHCGAANDTRSAIFGARPWAAPLNPASEASDPVWRFSTVFTVTLQRQNDPKEKLAMTTTVKKVKKLRNGVDCGTSDNYQTPEAKRP
jgi:hypothetical protein